MFEKLIIAVNKRGNVLVVKEFPDDECHAGLNEMIEEFEENVTLEEAPGLYFAEVEVERTSFLDPTDDSALLEIKKLTKIEVEE